TYYTKSQDELGRVIDDSLFRDYFDLRADVVGPVLTRIWDTPDNGYAEKYKHLIEPNFSIQRVSLIDVYDRIVKLESDDYTVGGTTRMSYGVTNRFLARRRGLGQAREFLNVNLAQTYYTNAAASQYDPAYGSSFTPREPSNFSPILLSVRANPADRTSGALRLEYDYSLRTLLTVRASGVASVASWGDVTGGWSRRRYATSDRVDNLLNLGTTLKALQNRYGGSYALDYDFARDSLVQQRILGYYNVAASTSRSRWLAWAPSRTSSAPWAAATEPAAYIRGLRPLIVSTRQTTMSRAGQPLKPDAQ
ncbi:MAG: lptD, partial [Acidobacteria bacterium]|nr:lptD [Acidobacteriota bacterium]